MARKEFPRAVKVAVILRATRDHVVYCEKCGVSTRKWQIDHVIADAHGGKPVIENAELICEACWSVKNPQDTKIAAKLKRQQAKAIGAGKPAGKIQSAPLPTTERAVKRQPKPSLPPRELFR